MDGLIKGSTAEWREQDDNTTVATARTAVRQSCSESESALWGRRSLKKEAAMLFGVLLLTHGYLSANKRAWMKGAMTSARSQAVYTVGREVALSQAHTLEPGTFAVPVRERPKTCAV